VVYIVTLQLELILPERIHSQAVVETRAVGKECRQRGLEEQPKRHLMVPAGTPERRIST